MVGKHGARGLIPQPKAYRSPPRSDTWGQGSYCVITKGWLEVVYLKARPLDIDHFMAAKFHVFRSQ